eukprot:2710634-Prymnesium_polylepis.1
MSTCCHSGRSVGSRESSCGAARSTREGNCQWGRARGDVDASRRVLDTSGGDRRRCKRRRRGGSGGARGGVQ